MSIIQVTIPRQGIFFVGRRNQLIRDIEGSTRFDSLEHAKDSAAWVRELLDDPGDPHEDVQIRIFSHN